MSNTEQRAFTPGPWRVDEHLNVMAAGGLVAFPGIAAGFDQAANARLIAAAPDLLFQLQAAANYIDALGGDSKSYRAALTRATTP